MFYKIEEVYNYLFNRHYSKKIDKDSFKKMMTILGNPERRLKAIHVAGTNGKGSTTNYISQLLITAGYKVGSFTSPHLLVHNDRIRINNQNISDQQLIDYANEYEVVWNKHDLSMFEIDTFIAIIYFLKEEVDFAVFEVGIGGRLDATNILMPLVSVITNIGYDHQSFLGNSLREIAFEKAGIIKPGIPLVTTEKSVECLRVFEEICFKKSSLLLKVTDYKSKFLDRKIVLNYKGEEYLLNTSASYQGENASLALAVIDYLNEHQLACINQYQKKEALEYTYWQGRFQIIQNNPLTILDGAHNISGIQQLLQEIKKLPEPYYVVFAAMKDKDYLEMLTELLKEVTEVVVTDLSYKRAAVAQELAEPFNLSFFKNYKEAISYFIGKYKNADEKDLKGSIILTGSLYFVSEVMIDLNKGKNNG